MGQRVESLNERHKLMLYMDIGGASVKEIAQVLGYTPQRVSEVRNSPLYIAQKQDIQERIDAQTIQSVAELLSSKRVRSVEVTGDLMENSDAKTPHAVQLAAAERIYKWSEPASAHQGRQVIMISETVARTMAQVLVEAGMSPPEPPIPAIDLAEYAEGCAKTEKAAEDAV